MNKFIESVVLNVIPEIIPNAVITALAKGGWERLLYNKDTMCVTAHLEIKNTILGDDWSCKLACSVTWKPGNDRIRLDIEITEKNHNWSHRMCKEMTSELASEININIRELPPSALKVSTGARLGTLADLIDAGFVDWYCGPQNLIITKIPTINGDLYVRAPVKYSVQHCSAKGATGSGKTVAYFTTNLADEATLGCNAIVTEAKGSKGRADLFCKTAGYRKAHGHEVFYIDPSSLRSHRFNILDLATTYDDVLNIVDIVMRSTTLGTHKGDQFWQMAESLLLQSLIMHSISLRNDGHCQMSSVFDLLAKGATTLGPILGRSEIPEAAFLYEGFLQNSTDDLRNSIAGGLMSRLSIWNSPRIRALTSKTDLDFAALKGQLFTWYNAVQADRFELKPLAALTFNATFMVIAKYSFDHPIKYCADELANQGKVRNLAQRLTIMRHDNISFSFGYQDFQQLKNEFGEEAPLFASQPAIRIIFPPRDLESAERASRELGTQEEKITVITSSGQIEEKTEVRPVMPVSELMQMQPGEIMVFTPVAPPVKLQALTWQYYSEQTDEQRYPPPYPPPLDVNEHLGQSASRTAQQGSTEDFSPSRFIDSDADLLGGWADC